MKHEQPDTKAHRPIADLSDLTPENADAVFRLARELRQEWRRERYSRLKPDSEPLIRAGARGLPREPGRV